MSTFETDYIMRQIKGMAAVLAKLFFGKEATEYVLPEYALWDDTDRLHEKLKKLIEEGKPNEAENLLFSSIRPEERRYLSLGIDFYARLEKLGAEKLAESGFGEEDIARGLTDLARIYGLELEEEQLF